MASQITIKYKTVIIIITVIFLMLIFTNKGEYRVADHLDYLERIESTKTKWKNVSNEKVGDLPKEVVAEVGKEMIELNFEWKEIKKKVGDKEWSTFQEVMDTYLEYEALLTKDTILSLEYSKNHPYQLILSEETIDIEKIITNSTLKNNKKEDIEKYALNWIKTSWIDIDKLNKQEIVELANNAYLEEQKSNLAFLKFIFADIQNNN